MNTTIISLLDMINYVIHIITLVCADWVTRYYTNECQWYIDHRDDQYALTLD